MPRILHVLRPVASNVEKDGKGSAGKFSLVVIETLCASNLRDSSACVVDRSKQVSHSHASDLGP